MRGELATPALVSRACGVAIALALLATATSAHARTTIVPDDFPTIQAALDDLRADTILVRPGDYPEIIGVSGEPAIVGMGMVPGGEPTVRIEGLRACYGGGIPNNFTSGVVHGGQRYSGIRFMGPVLVCNTNGPVHIGFRDCRFDADITWNDGGNYPDLTQVAFQKCMFFGSTDLRAQSLIADSSTFHGPLTFRPEYEAYVRGNRFEDVPGVAITVLYPENEAHVIGNHVRGGVTGIRVLMGGSDLSHVDDNRVEGCSGDGIVADASSYRAYVERNVVSSCGGVGIRALGNGVAARGNRVFDCSGTGISLSHEDDPGIVEGNVVGRCKGSGIVLTHSPHASYGIATVRANTVFSCSVAGIVLQDPTAGSVSNNLSCFNTGVGFVITSGGPVDLSCNDWYANGGGETNGDPAPTDLAIDPRFCDGVNGDGSLMSDSPLLDAAGCGRIGALGQGCEAPAVAVGFELWPRVLQPAARSRWVTAWLEPPAPFSVTDIDLATVRVNDVPVAQGFEATVGDQDGDGVPDLQLRIDRSAIERTLTAGDDVEVHVTGRIGARSFTGTCAIRVLRGGPRSSAPRPTPRVLSIQAPATNFSTGSLRVAFTLVEDGPARLDILDVAGRLVASHEVGSSGPGEHTVELAGGAHLAQGIYLLRLRQGTGEARTRMVAIR